MLPRMISPHAPLLLDGGMGRDATRGGRIGLILPAAEIARATDLARETEAAEEE